MSIESATFSTRLAGLASLKLTVVSLAFLSGSAVLLVYWDVPPTMMLIVPFFLLGINLIAAIFIVPAFRSKVALQIFHLALLVILILAAFSRLTYFKGQFELSAGELFAGKLMAKEQGPWHFGALEQVVFSNEWVKVVFESGGKRGPTHNAVRWFDAQGTAHSRIIGDNTPLILHGYRIYPSRHFGYAPLFSWLPSDHISPSRGTINLPSLRMGAGLSSSWTIPGTEITALAMLQLKQPVPNTIKKTLFVRGGEHTLLVTIRGESHAMQPGDRLILPEGLLVYENLATWMGYTLFFDQTIPWLLTASLVAVASLALHFRNKFVKKSWQAVEP